MTRDSEKCDKSNNLVALEHDAVSSESERGRELSLNVKLRSAVSPIGIPAVASATSDTIDVAKQSVKCVPSSHSESTPGDPFLYIFCII